MSIFYCSILTFICLLILNCISAVICQNFIKNTYRTKKLYSFNLGLVIFNTFIINIICTLFLLSIMPSYEIACIITIVCYFVFFIISYLKFLVLKEPIVYSDFALIKEMFISPRLYFAYVPIFAWIFIAFLILVFFYILYRLPFSYIDFYDRLIYLLFSIVLLIITNKFLLNKKLSYNSLIDGASISPLFAFCIQLKEFFYAKRFIKKYGVEQYLNLDVINENSLKNLKQNNISNKDYEDKNQTLNNLFTANNKFKNVILVQGESFCNLTRLGFSKYARDFSKDSKFKHLGLLDIDYLGAYTMRSEFSVLTGLTREKLKIFSYDPYLLARNYKLNSLANFYREQGYKTICIHANSKKFFARDRVLHNLGFDCFIAKENMPNLCKNGHNVSDFELFKYVKTLLNNDEKMFIFVITMEAHGPWSCNGDEIIKDNLVNDDLIKIDKKSHFKLKDYSTHIHSMCMGLEYLSNNLENSCILMYGDHLPSINGVLKSKALLKPDIYVYKEDLKDSSVNSEHNFTTLVTPSSLNLNLKV